MSDICTPYYDNQYTFTITSGAVATNTAILHPNIFYIADSWSSINNYDFWNKNYTDVTVNNYEVKKTIYSPSLTGYAEPKPASFTGFTTTTGRYTTNSNEFNVGGTFNKGWNFYCKPTFQGSTVFFSALGQRSADTGAFVAVCGDGNYWSAGPSGTSTYARHIGFNSSAVFSRNENHRAYGYTVRPTSE